MILRLARRGRRFGLMLGGEALQSAFHFALNVVLARLLPPADYGVFAIAMLIGGIALTYMRSGAAMPANLLIPQHRGRPRVLAFEAMANCAALLLGLLFFALAALALELWLHADALAGGLFVALWSLRSYFRAFLFAHGEAATASLGDGVFALAGAGLGGALLLSGGALSLQSAFLLMASANGFSLAAGLALHRRPFPLTLRRSTLRRVRGMAEQVLWASAGVTAGTVQAQGQVLLIAALAGPAAYAPVAAMLVVLAPLRLVSSALANMAQPDLAALVAEGRHAEVWRCLVLWTSAGTLAGFLYAPLMAAAVPLMGEAVFQDQPRLLIGVFAWGISVAPLLYLMPKVFLEVRRTFAWLAAVNAAAALVGLASVSALLVVASPAWSMLGTLLSEAMVLALCWAAALRHLGRRPERENFVRNSFSRLKEAKP